jgi:DNA-binding transcriptional ArsR family regulator
MTTDRCEFHEVNPEKVQEAKAKLLSDEMYANLAQTFSALADSNRAKIIYSLIGNDLCVCDISSVVGISESAVSQHLRILRNLRLVNQWKDGRMVYYKISDDHIGTLLDVCLEHVRHE